LRQISKAIDCSPAAKCKQLCQENGVWLDENVQTALRVFLSGHFHYTEYKSQIGHKFDQITLDSPRNIKGLPDILYREAHFYILASQLRMT